MIELHEYFNIVFLEFAKASAIYKEISTIGAFGITMYKLFLLYCKIDLTFHDQSSC